MKAMTCKQLGGACDKVFQANTFDEIAALSKAHGSEMFKLGDKPHLEAMNAMMELMHNPADMKKWMDDKRQEFENIPDN